jgi:hypothetical protein
MNEKLLKINDGTLKNVDETQVGLYDGMDFDTVRNKLIYTIN